MMLVIIYCMLSKSQLAENIEVALKVKFMVIELPRFDFEKHHLNAVAIEPSLDKVRQFLDKKGVKRNEYAPDNQVMVGFGELFVKKKNDF